MKRWWMLGLGLSLLAAACGGRAEVVNTIEAPQRTSTTIAIVAADDALAALSAARDRWDGAAPDDYTVSLQSECTGCDDNPQTVAVREGEVVSLSATESPTVDSVFDTIERSLDDGADVEVEYDPDLGYPRRVRIDFDRDGIIDLDLSFDDLRAMPVVESLEELLDAKARWDAQGYSQYRYIFRADCDCPAGGTWDVTVDSGSVDYTPLGEAAAETNLTPGDLDDAFRDLEEWFTSSQQFVDEGILDVDVRMDPELGYPRWFRIVAEGIDDDDFEQRFTLIVTIDVIAGAGTGPEVLDGADGQALTEAMQRWERAGVREYSYTWTRYCECDIDVRGPFRVEMVGDKQLSVVRTDDGSEADPSAVSTIDDAFARIGLTIKDGIDVDVEYHPILGYPMVAVLDPEAVAVDGGYAFAIEDIRPTGGSALLIGAALSGPHCPVQQDPPQPGCEDQPVADAPIMIGELDWDELIPIPVAEDGTFVLLMQPGTFVIEAQPVDGLLGTPQPVGVTIEAGEVHELLLSYDTGIR